MFRSQGAQRLEELINTVERKVSPLMNEFLIADYTEQEITAALNGIGDIKAPDPDGMPAIFFKKILGANWAPSKEQGSPCSKWPNHTNVKETKCLNQLVYTMCSTKSYQKY
jgi:hypothetical protein